MLKTRKIYFLAFVWSALVAVSCAWAQGPKPIQRATSDALFTEPRGSAINQLLLTAGDLIAFQMIRPKLPEGRTLVEADQRLLSIVHSDRPDELKLREIHDAETDLARARLVALQSIQEKGIIPQIVRYARVVGTTLVLVDIAGRAWVWSALNANPTWSPAATMIESLAEDLSTRNALPSR